MRVRELARYHVRGDVSLGSLVDKLRKVSVFTIMGDWTHRDRSHLFQFSAGLIVTLVLRPHVDVHVYTRVKYKPEFKLSIYTD